MWVYLVMGLSVLTIYWEEVTNRYKVIALTTGFSIVLGGVMLLKNTKELYDIKKVEKEKPKYELIHEEVYRKIK